MSISRQSTFLLHVIANLGVVEATRRSPRTGWVGISEATISSFHKLLIGLPPLAAWLSGYRRRSLAGGLSLIYALSMVDM